MGKFDGKVALVMGAGRMRGIGRYAALAFANEGASVAVTRTGRDSSTFPRDEQEAGWRDVDSVAQEINQNLGIGAIILSGECFRRCPGAGCDGPDSSRVWPGGFLGEQCQCL